MFAIIDTKGANKIAIHIPHQGAEKTLPALAAMLEQNATFINSGYYDAVVVKPEMSIHLGDNFQFDTEKPEIVITKNASVISDDFVIDAPEVRISYKKAIEAKDKEIERFRAERDLARAERDALQARIDAMLASDIEDGA